ncbi:glycerophosphodiester phosphodiesterase [Saccharibacillus sp. CPCC 101409]|uniref:glycerophosphodiester phosphodiesterase n=1 Tax=Saccharibacillus sp. CPCC 101409 TaxID=3058041 RepID=UPI0026724763|nr:glycerophosphodiester phosphodiesterase [Saccharibacillus sp. CPCC 101409]MDO3413187.1 glycerophosphodiester phosphodiesterase [Saccharibacillus sp. CPCC 101409]
MGMESNTALRGEKVAQKADNPANISSAFGRPGSPLIFAHRGASGSRPENTMEAFRRAAALGAGGIETDVQLSLDGEPVLIHDETLSRTAGACGRVSDKTYAELRELDAGGWYHPDFVGERIPHLDELLELAAQTVIVLNIELKNNILPYTGMEEKVIAAVRGYGLERRTILSSFNHYSVALCKRLAPEIRTGLLYMEGLYRPWDYARSIGADALHAYDPAVQAEWVREARENGVDYHPFTVNDPARIKELIGMGVSGIITDHPDVAMRCLAETKVGYVQGKELS